MEKAVQNISFHYLVEPFHFPNRNKLKEFLAKRLKKEKKVIESINYIFCTDEYLLQFNRQYLDHDTLTDIITFELSSKGQPLLSDIYISYERVKENAGLYRTSVLRELHRVIFHGALHLAGYKDKNKNDQAVMREMENRWL